MHGLFLSASGKAERKAEVRPVRTGDPPITGDARLMVLHRLGAISVPTPLAGRLKLCRAANGVLVPSSSSGPRSAVTLPPRCFSPAARPFLTRNGKLKDLLDCALSVFIW